jgi:hypothetical protein
MLQRQLLKCALRTKGVQCCGVRFYSNRNILKLHERGMFQDIFPTTSAYDDYMLTSLYHFSLIIQSNIISIMFQSRSSWFVQCRPAICLCRFWSNCKYTSCGKFTNFTELITLAEIWSPTYCLGKTHHKYTYMNFDRFLNVLELKNK